MAIKLNIQKRFCTTNNKFRSEKEKKKKYSEMSDRLNILLSVY